MGYACPVCGTPQRDGEHLAHHLAFTAMIHGDDHEAWLDEHAPDWGGMDPAGLAESVVDHAEETEYHEVFEDTVDRGRPDVDFGVRGGGHAGDDGHGHARSGGHDHATGGGTADVSELDPEAAAAVREARELTREMHEDGAGPDADGDDTTDGDADPDGDADEDVDGDVDSERNA